MSRKIKYRVWDEENKKYCTEYDAMALKHDGEFCIERGWCIISGGFEVEQSTLLKDKNGKEIYEGDIIQETIMADDRTDGTYRYEVYWDEDTLCWSIKGISDIDYHLRDDLWETNASREVIGNIHENGELTGGEE